MKLKLIKKIQVESTQGLPCDPLGSSFKQRQLAVCRQSAPQWGGGP